MVSVEIAPAETSDEAVRRHSDKRIVIEIITQLYKNNYLFEYNYLTDLTAHT